MPSAKRFVFRASVGAGPSCGRGLRRGFGWRFVGRGRGHAIVDVTPQKV